MPDYFLSLGREPGKVAGYLAIPGLTALELDVKDETGKVGFLMPAGTLARRVGASQPYYKARAVARQAHAVGVYLIGRVVVFEDPTLTAARPDLAIQHSDGSVWVNSAGLGWANPYDERVWKYVVGIGQAAARAGFDEIQFDYVRFPTDGDLSSAVFHGKTDQTKTQVITSFAKYASEQLKPLGVRVSADVFGLSATRDLGIGQRPIRTLELEPERETQLAGGQALALVSVEERHACQQRPGAAADRLEDLTGGPVTRDQHRQIAPGGRVRRDRDVARGHRLHRGERFQVQLDDRTGDAGQVPARRGLGMQLAHSRQHALSSA